MGAITRPQVAIVTTIYVTTIYETERINTPGQKEVNELDYEFLEAERKVDGFFDEKYYEEEFHSTCPLVAQTTI